MYFTSTRAVKRISAAQAIAQGISEDGGLFVPSEFPALDCRTLDSLVNMSYKERAKKVPFAPRTSDPGLNGCSTVP